MATTAAGSGAGAIPPATVSGSQTGGPASPAMTTNFDKTVTALVRREILENLRPACRWLIPGAFIPGTLIEGTNLIRHIAYGDLPASGTDDIIAIEGTPPAEEALTIGYTEYSVKQRGRLVGMTDVAMKISPHELMAIAAERVAAAALLTVDASIATAVLAGTGLTLDVTGITTGLTANIIRRWVAQMKAAEIPTFPDGFYVAIIHPNVLFDLQGDASIGGWIEASKYGNPDNLLTGEIGRMYGMRFVESTVQTITPGAGATDTYTSVVFGPDYFAYGDLMSVETYMVRPGGDHSDPLAQKALVGYKGMWGAKTIEVPEISKRVALNPLGVRYGKAVAHAGSLQLTG